jgi:PadR family transcriptional regulator AphA
VPASNGERAPPEGRGPSLAEHLILGLIAERPAHGFALARIVAPDGPVGRVYEIPRPVVYRSIGRLVDLRLVEPQAVEQGGGPQRTVVRSTPAGIVELQSWLARPVEHVRDLRTELMAKLALLDRAGADPAPLVAAQRMALLPIVAALTEQKGRAQGFDRTILTWRYHAARAAIRFLDDLGKPENKG